MARRLARRQTYLGSGFELSVNGGILGMKGILPVGIAHIFRLSRVSKMLHAARMTGF